ncbi:hypothetical protein AC578_9034 [Pseudocercospora eumusae]|uniref:Uncharacterized protein n=1 Tax=Pseudocercospora eumusae TaxID=321146 RepID=A0A139H8K1_9PEZI|nr:hypothetical protein AC578_9034 [Pseudocercospora eumusae]
MSHMIPTMKLVRLSGQLAPTSKLLAFPRSIQGVVLCVSITSELVLDIAAVASVRPDTVTAPELDKADRRLGAAIGPSLLPSHFDPRLGGRALAIAVEHSLLLRTGGPLRLPPRGHI